ncbi:PEP-CTERM sorting domain-containing protein [Bythopirellula polymerisocia]|uniref:Putative lipoprotein n=1 Tax=Bythopirellula polymerisocia TaxID=2528003 RepID=A0A5C6D5E9_9BACT|nr:PEP-CTERM sorting domain-containing protein [Bythopirellula polymerisocia]TWU30446.1 putative lipoprotein [Bythopirellula polymerisocia]
MSPPVFLQTPNPTSTQPNFALVLLTLTLAISHCHQMTEATTFYRTTGGGPFRQASLWSPYFPPTFFGPGNAADVVRFNLGTNPNTPYVMTNVTGENNRLLVGNDSLVLEIDQYKLTNSAGEISLNMGLAATDISLVSLEGTTDSQMTTRSTVIADVSGSSATLDVHDIQFNSGLTIVGYRGNGTLAINDGAHVTTSQTYIADLPNAVGSLFVDGNGSHLTSGELEVGVAGTGYFNLYNGGQAISSSASIGKYADSLGVASSTDIGTEWIISNLLEVGSHGKGNLNVYNGGHVTAARSAVGIYPDGMGTVSVSKPDSLWTIAGTLSIGGDSYYGHTQGHGKVNITNQGKIDVGGTTTIYAGGELNLYSGLFTAPAIALQGGIFNWTGGTLTVEMINGNVTNTNGILAPGNVTGSTTIAGSYTQSAGGKMAIDLGGISAGSSYDSIGVAGSAILGGTLELNLANGFRPEATNTFSVFNAVGGLIGVFNNIGSGQRLTLGNGAGSFLVNYGVTSTFDPNQVVLSNFLPTYSADFDLDGDVDSADLLIWQNSFGVNALADADGDGDSDGRDFLAWQRQISSGVSASIIASGSISSAIPEPSTLLLFAFAAMGVVHRRDSILKKVLL